MRAQGTGKKDGRFLTAVVSVLAIAVVSCIVVGVRFYRSVGFDPAVLRQAAGDRGTIFTDRYGRELRSLPDALGERGNWVPVGDVPEVVRNAFVAAEDKRFARHPGFDWIAIIRALRANIAKGRIVSGASTISQQVVRMACAGGQGPPCGEAPERHPAGRTYGGKLVEIVQSIKLEKTFTKDVILEYYLNNVPMGNNIVGIATAARAYFGSPVGNLSASEAALLASLPKAPSSLNPYGDGAERLRERRDWVLTRMERLGYLTEAEAGRARSEAPRYRKLAFAAAAPHVTDMLLRRGIAGGRVRTTIDLNIQDAVRKMLASHAERLRHRGAAQAAAIVVHNPTRDVLAAVGSVEYSGRDGGYNNGVRALRSAGSTLKPFLYGLALETGETTASLLDDIERTYRSREGQYAPLNYDRREYGPVKVRTALGSSLNLSAVRMLQRVGERRFYDVLQRLGLINHPDRGPDHYGLGMAIGNPEVSPEQLAAAYAALANYGVFEPVRYVLSVEPSVRGGAPAVQAPGTRRRERTYLLLPQTAYIVTDMLADPTARMLTFKRSRTMMDFPFRLSVKTGTSTFYRDLWTVGYTPEYTVAVWVGNFDGSPTRYLSGSTAAAPIFSDIMSYLYRYSSPVAFQRPRGVVRFDICGYSGMRPTDNCPHRVRELFIAGTEPTEACSFHRAGPERHELAAPFAGWLYRKSRTDSAGRFRLSGFGDDLRAVFQDPWEGVEERLDEPVVRIRTAAASGTMSPTPDREEGARDRPRGHYSIGAEEVPSGRPGATEGADVRIVYPLDRDRFVRDRFTEDQFIRFQAVVDRTVAYVDWFVNGRLYKRTGPPYQTYWPLRSGTYRITAVTPDDAGDSIRLAVE